MAPVTYEQHNHAVLPLRQPSAAVRVQLLPHMRVFIHAPIVATVLLLQLLPLCIMAVVVHLHATMKLVHLLQLALL